MNENNEVFITIKLEDVKLMICELKAALNPLVPYSKDPLVSAKVAIDCKDMHIYKALEFFPDDLSLEIPKKIKFQEF